MKYNKITKSAATIISLAALAASQAPAQAPAQAAPAQAVPVQSVPAQSAPAGAPDRAPDKAPAQSSGGGVTKTQTQSSSTLTLTSNAGKKKAVKRGAPAAPVKPPKPPWQEFKLNPKTTMTLDFTDANPDMILSMFARTSGITIVKDPSLKTTLTVQSASSVHLSEAFSILNTVLKLNGYELQKEGDLLIAGKKAAEAQTPPPQPPPQPQPPAQPDTSKESVVKFYPLTYANADSVAKVINDVFTQQQLENLVQQMQQGGGNPQFQQFGRPGAPPAPRVVRASAEDYSNTVIVNAPEANQKDVEALIKKIDISTQTPLDTETFRLKFVTVDEVVDAVKNVLTSNAPVGRGSAKAQSNDNNNFYYNPYRQNTNSSATAGGQSAIAVKQTNSVIVSATKDNMEIVRKLILNLDSEAAYVGTTSVIHLENAKATDVATLLNTAFTKRRDQSQGDNPYFLVYSDYPSPGSKTDVATDMDEKGQIVNVRDLTGKVNIVADPNTNSLIVVTLPSNIRLIKKIVDAIDVVAAQVMIETIIVEANLDKTTKLGVEWNFSQNSVLNTNATATTAQNFGLQSQAALPAGFQYTLSAANYKAFVNALETNNRYKILDTPRIFTSNNVQAKIDVSQQYPYTLNTSTSSLASGLIATTSFLTIGVVLTVTPRITAAGEVSMDVDQTADDLQGLSPAGAPIVNHREAKSTVTIHDGQTILLGGIISQNLTINESKIPLLGDIPLIGKLFTSSSRENTQTELMVFMTPHIVIAPSEAIKIRQVGENDLSKSSKESIDRIIKQDEIKN